ncbi:poly(A)-binding protein binding protein [Recurvomyces mirabilis]|uniref:Poly(A)-binding protein binding protein n=1 Tax=Recurvomyces mirabilis TaxID=574656 RepID=A0AAE0TTW8_9PEZI|nr:poly(A)-binding protein binding protein [Recurvomyces mirabilis]KAK5156496.1 poly(A)-binding protein binding protein [Recurvomyces mirabilis]
MSAAAVNGSDANRSSSTNSPAPKQQFKSGTNAGKALDGARKQNGSPVDGQNRKQQQSSQPKAWQGTNPITQPRTSSGMTNGTEKPLLKLPQQAQQAPPTSRADSPAEKHAHDRLLFAVANCIGLDATLTLKNGEQFTGVLAGATFDSSSKSKYVLKMVKQTQAQGEAHMNGDTSSNDEYIGEGEDHVMSFDVQDTTSLVVDDVVTTGSQPQQNGTAHSSFLTDTQISGREPTMPRERELQRWDASADTDVDLSLDAGGQTGWDQFAVNEQMYGVQDTYDENIYTTAIDRSDPRFRQKEAEAAKIAREIEGSSAGNAHVAEERRADADKDDGLDEEEKYSGVRREPSVQLPKRSTGAYVPPSQRPITGAPTVQGAPFDPAIISVARPVPAAPAQPEINEPTALPERTKPAEAETTSRDTSVPAAASQTPRVQADQAEDHVRKTADAFKQFANLEKLKARQAQEQKRAGARQEKNVKLNDLKKFAANFKLNSRVPDDLVPILAKDREKQQEIQRKAEEAAKEHEVTAEDRKKRLSAGATPPAPASITPQMNAGPTPEQRTPFNQHSRPRASQHMRGGPSMSNQTQSPRAPAGQGRGNQGYGRGGMVPIQPLGDIRIPSGPALSADRAPLSPSSANRLNINATEFRPTASTFTPSGTTPSPQRKMSKQESAAEPSAHFFGKEGKASTLSDRGDIEATFESIDDMLSALDTLNEQQKQMYAGNGGIPQPYRTPPTWPGVDSLTYKDDFSKRYPSSQGPSPMHTPGPHGPPMAHQLPQHMQGQHMTPPTHRQQYYQQQQQGPHMPAFDPRMQQFGPNGSVQNSPRFNPAQMAYPGQMQHMPMPQFAGQPMQGQYGMSPSMQHRPMPGMQQGGPQQMMMGGGMLGQQYGQQVPQNQRGYPQAGGPPFGNQQMAPMMMHNPSQGGGYMNGPAMQQQQQQHQSYSPMPPHAQPNMPGHPGHGTPGPGGYNASPRPPMMTPQGSHQGFNPQMHGIPQPQFGSHGPVPPGQGQSQGQPHPMHMQQRQLSSGYMPGGGGGGYPQATPRQQQAVPSMQMGGVGSPGMGGGPGLQHGEEGKGG